MKPALHGPPHRRGWWFKYKEVPKISEFPFEPLFNAQTSVAAPRQQDSCNVPTFAAAAMLRKERVKIAAVPSSVGRLSKIVKSDDYTIADLVKVVSEDQVLSAYLLRYANSPAYRGVEPVSRLSDAILRLGSRETLVLTIAVGLGAQVVGEGPLQSLRQNVWRRSAFTAAFCRQMASSRHIEEDEAFLCGLLFNFPVCVALACIEKGFHPTESAVFSAEFWMDVASRHSEELGGVLAETWNLPPLVASVIAAQYSEVGVESSIEPFVTLIHLANAICDVVETTSTVTAEQLVGLPGVRDIDDAVQIAEMIPRIPHIVHDMTPEVEGGSVKKQRKTAKRPPRNARAAKAKEKHPVQLLPAEPSLVESSSVELGFGVLHHRSGASAEYRCNKISALAMGVVGKQSMVENSVVKITVNCDPAPFTLFAIVTFCRHRGTDYQVEIRPMALDGENQRRWDELVARQNSNSNAEEAKAILPVVDELELLPEPVPVVSRSQSRPEEEPAVLTLQDEPEPAPESPQYLDVSVPSMPEFAVKSSQIKMSPYVDQAQAVSITPRMSQLFAGVKPVPANTEVPQLAQTGMIPLIDSTEARTSLVNTHSFAPPTLEDVTELALQRESMEISAESVQSRFKSPRTDKHNVAETISTVRPRGERADPRNFFRGGVSLEHRRPWVPHAMAGGTVCGLAVLYWMFLL